MKFSEVLQEYLSLREMRGGYHAYSEINEERKKRLLRIMDKMIPETYHVETQVTLVSKCK